MLGNINRLVIDVDKLRKELEQHELSLAQASRGIGHADSYLSNCIGRPNNSDNTPQIPLHAMKSLELMYGITYESIKPDSKEEENTPKKNEIVVEHKNATTDLSEVTKKIDELIVAINRLGNVQMQEMEYTKSILDSTAEINRKTRNQNIYKNK